MAITIGGKTPQSINIGGKDVQSLAINGEVVWSLSVADYFWINSTDPRQQTLSVTKNGTPTTGTDLQWSKDKATWTTVTYTNGVCEIPVTHEKVYFRSTTGFSNGVSNYYSFDVTDAFEVGGKLETLINYIGSYTAANGSFARLFYNSSNITDASALDIELTNLPQSCFLSAFQGCTNLTVPPTLPYTAMSSNCYNSMFRECTSLTSVPALGATSLADSCFKYMFRGCTGINAAPTLGYTTLASYCYQGMFRECTGITSAPALNATSLAAGCYYEMFQGCTGLTTVMASLPATTAHGYCYSYMFQGCTHITETPEIHLSPAQYECMTYMFSGCTSLTKATVYSTSWNTSYANSWMSNVSASGTFYNMNHITIPTSSSSGIPSGWSQYVEGFYLEALQSSAKFTIKRGSTQSQGTTLQYSIDDGTTWSNVTYSSNVFTKTISSVGGKIYLRSTDGFNLQINCDKNYKASGDLKYLVDYTASGQVDALGSNFYNMFYSSTTLQDISGVSFSNISSIGSYTCCLMFYGCTGLTDVSSLAIPDMRSSTTNNCNSMFQGCSNITNVPSRMPQNDTIGEYAYNQMFAYCNNITTLNSNMLPATTLAKNCYYNMFVNCYSIVSVPSGFLPSTSLAESCYYYMFHNCTSLTTVPTNLLPATTAAKQCYCSMFEGCTSLTAAPNINLTTLAEQCCSYMFRDCTSLTTGPYIKSTSPSGTKTFYYMFQRCTKINWVKVNWTSWSVSSTGPTGYWFDGAKNTSACKFYLPSAAATPTRGSSGIPSSWTIVRF